MFDVLILIILIRQKKNDLGLYELIYILLKKMIEL
jgi:hypothetical protein